MFISGEAGKDRRPGTRGASHAPGRAWCGKSWRVVVCADAAAAPPGTDGARRILAALIAGRLLAQADRARDWHPGASAADASPGDALRLLCHQGGE